VRGDRAGAEAVRRFREAAFRYKAPPSLSHPVEGLRI
jgi:hypothetical protein